MKELLKNSGVILVLIGVAILAIPQFSHSTTNTSLVIGAIFTVLGIIATIILYKYVE
ncbi:MAG: hypothetical protein Q4F97_09075 [Bacteroidales bacterium]|nr:hypothetical protein [Bacteroidales bacterium]